MSSSPAAAPKVKKSVALSGVAAGNTALCTVGRTGNDLHYRGYDILHFADKAEFEEIAYLLIYEKLPTRQELTAYKARMLREREAAFRRLDANKDGSLSLQEFNALAASQAVPKANAAPVLARFDTNKDGKVSLAENRAPAMAQFDRADTNKDGTLSVQERQALARRR